MDDGGGAMISWTVLSLLHSLDIRAKRTVRCVLWSCEEFAGIGGDQYYTAHENEVPSMSIVMESDLGVFHPQGIQFTGQPEAQQARKRNSIFFFKNDFLDYQIYIVTIGINQCNTSCTRW
jgi:acetylornithine deacetylase/succinyl-diaminopimelate desuccinylase-like protein